MNVYTSNWILLLPIGFSLFIALQLNEGSTDSRRRTFGTNLLYMISALCIYFSSLGIIFRAGPTSGFWGIVIGILSVVLLFKSRRLARTTMLLTLFETEHLHQRQSVLNHFVEFNRGYVRRKGRKLLRDLALGLHWSDSMLTHRIAKGFYEKLALGIKARFGSRVDQLDEKQQLIDPITIQEETERLLGRLVFFSSLILFVPIFTLIMYFIVPTFYYLFTEFAIEIPWTMRQLLMFGDWVDQTWIKILLLLLFQAILIVALGILLLWIFPGLLQLPPFRWFAKSYFRTLGYTAFLRAFDQEQDLVAACSTTAEIVPARFLAEQYRLAAQRILSGTPPADAMCNSGILTSRESQMLASSIQAENLGWVFEQLAYSQTSRMLRWYSALIQCTTVIAILVLAMIVGFLAIALIESLSALILYANEVKP